jgi:hypothetical protein
MRRTLHKKQKRLRKTRRNNKKGGFNLNNGNYHTPYKNYPGEEVLQNDFKIIPKNKQLKTTGLATCSALVMYIGNKKFMAHLGALTDVGPIISAIKTTMASEQAEPTYPIIYEGSEYNGPQITRKKALEITNAIGLKNTPVIKSECIFNTYSI